MSLMRKLKKVAVKMISSVWMTMMLFQAHL